jgi:hypothetical protein
LKPESETAYIGYWKKFLTYSFRTALLPPKQRKKHGIQFTARQLALIHEIVELLNEHDYDSEHVSQKSSALGNDSTDTSPEDEDTIHEIVTREGEDFSII